MQDDPLCRFCLESKETVRNPLLDPCGCKGSMRFVHAVCLHRWRIQNPAKNAVICRLCFEPYRMFQPRHLEQIPSETGLSVFLLRFPVILTVSGGYLSLFQFTVVPQGPLLVDLLVPYQYGVQVVYFTLLYLHWTVKNKELYWRQWQPLRTALLSSLYFVSLLGLSRREFFSLVPLNVVLSMIWSVHCRILQQMNQRED
jgi:hypothetical protein